MIAEFVKTGNDTSCSMKSEVNSSLATYKTLHYEVRTSSSLFIFQPNDWPDRLIMYHQETEDHKQLVNVNRSVSYVCPKQSRNSFSLYKPYKHTCFVLSQFLSSVSFFFYL
jgi:hypothetical protein